MNIKRRCKVVMLPTNKKSDLRIVRGYDGNALCYDPLMNPTQIYNNKNHTLSYHHLYIISDEEIKEGDWYIIPEFKKVYHCTSDIETIVIKDAAKKIIATTDKFLKYNISRKLGITQELPKLTLKFIEMFVSEYDKGHVIEFVDVEYTYDNGGIFVPMNTLYLLVNSDNTINIEPIKYSWSKEDVIALLYKSRFHKDSSDEKFDKWIEQNI